MRIAIAANHYPVASGRCMLEAFRRIGSEARSTGKALRTKVWGPDLPVRYAWMPDDVLGFVPPCGRCGKGVVALFFFMDGHGLPW